MLRSTALASWGHEGGGGRLPSRAPRRARPRPARPDRAESDKLSRAVMVSVGLSHRTVALARRCASGTHALRSAAPGWIAPQRLPWWGGSLLRHSCAVGGFAAA